VSRALSPVAEAILRELREAAWPGRAWVEHLDVERDPGELARALGELAVAGLVSIGPPNAEDRVPVVLTGREERLP
jgi:hypothetical protein